MNWMQFEVARSTNKFLTVLISRFTLTGEEAMFHLHLVRRNTLQPRSLLPWPVRSGSERL
jgi:hypothetical protein